MKVIFYHKNNKHYYFIFTVCIFMLSIKKKCNLQTPTNVLAVTERVISNVSVTNVVTNGYKHRATDLWTISYDLHKTAS